MQSRAAGARATQREKVMFDIGDLFQWERFITPSIIKLFYWLVVVHRDPGRPVRDWSRRSASWRSTRSRGVFMALASLVGMLVGILFARIVAEFVLIVFRINEHLGAIRNRGGM